MPKDFYDPDRAEAAAELWAKLATFEGEDADAQLIIEKAMSEYACTADKRIEDSDWAQQYKGACIDLSKQHDRIEELQKALAEASGRLQALGYPLNGAMLTRYRTLAGPHA